MSATFDYDLLLQPRGVAFKQLAQMPDSEGRPCAAEALLTDAQAAQLERRRCPYPGSRHNHALPMNVTALRQMSRHWDELMALVRTLRAGYVQRTGRNELGLLDVLQLSHAVVSLVVYCVSRSASTAEPASVPAYVSGAHKAYFDIETTSGLLLLSQTLSGEGDAAFDSPVSAQGLLDFAEETGVLIGVRGVCAGPGGHILEAIETLLNGGTPRTEDEANVRAWLGDVPRFLDYAAASFLIDKLKGWHFVRQRAHAARAAARPETSAPLRASLAKLDQELAHAARNILGNQPIPAEACGPLADALLALVLRSTTGPAPTDVSGPAPQSDADVLRELLRQSAEDERWLIGVLKIQGDRAARALGRPERPALTPEALHHAFGPSLRPFAERGASS